MPLAGAAADTSGPELSSPAAQRSIGESINAALQGDSRRAVEAFKAVPAEQFASKDADYRACMIERFGGTAPPRQVLRADDPFVSQGLGAYEQYWWNALAAPSKREALDAQLQQSIRALLGGQAAADDWDALETRLARRLRERGHHAWNEKIKYRNVDDNSYYIDCRSGELWRGNKCLH